MKTQLKTKTNVKMAVMVGVSAAAILGAMALIAVGARNVLSSRSSAVISARDTVLREDGFPVGVPTLIYSASDTSNKIENISLWNNKLAIREINSDYVSKISLMNIMTRSKSTLDLGRLNPEGHIDINADNLVFEAPSSSRSIFLYNFSTAEIRNISELEPKNLNPAIDASSSKAVWYVLDTREDPMENIVEYDLSSGRRTILDYPRSGEGPFVGQRWWDKSDLSYDYRTYNDLSGVYVENVLSGERGSLLPAPFEYYLHTASYGNRMALVWEYGSHRSRSHEGMPTDIETDIYRTAVELKQFKIDPTSGSLLLAEKTIKSTNTGDPILVINDVAIYENKIAWIEDNSRIYVYVIPVAWRNLFACNDSDGGRNYTTTGTVSANGLSLNDYCSNSDELVEGYCLGTESFTSSTQSCSSLGVGMACSDGRCVRSSDGESRSTTGGSVSATSTKPIGR